MRDVFYSPPLPGGAILLVLTVLVLLQPGLAGASTDGTGGETPPRFTSFAGVPWGASEDTVIHHHGHPRFESLIDAGPQLELAVRPESALSGKRMIYLELAPYREAMTVSFYVHPSRGLFKGVARFEPPGRNRCLETYRRVKNRVEERLTGIDPRVSGRDPPSYLSFCGAVRMGAAFRVIDWRDPGSSGLIRVSLKRGSPDVWLEFFSHDWVERLKTLDRFRTLMILHRQGRSLDALRDGGEVSPGRSTYPAS